MTQLHELLSNLYVLNVPMDGFGFKIDEWFTGKKNISCSTKGPMWSSDWLPPGNWSIICCSATATEEDAAKVVEKDLEDMRPGAYKNYQINELVCFRTTESLASLLRSRDLDPAKNYLILKLNYMSYGIRNFKKKPVIIQALQWTGHNATEIMLFVGKKLEVNSVPHEIEREIDDISNTAYQIDIPTREGVQTAIKLDWIIKEYSKKAGFHYWVCKPDYFKAAYEEMEDQETDYLTLYEIADKKAQQDIIPAEARYNDQH